MRTSDTGSSEPDVNAPKRIRRLKINVRTLVVLVATCGVILWAARRLWENSDPTLVEARSIQREAIGLLQSGKSAERVTGIHVLQRLGVGDGTVAIPPLIQALDDPETEVRSAAADALGSISASVVRSGSGLDAARASVMALSRRGKDPETPVRVAAAKALGSIADSLVKSKAKALGSSLVKSKVGALGSVANGLMKSKSGEETTRASGLALLQCLKDPEPDVRRVAAASLGIFNAQGPAAITVTSPSDRQVIMDGLTGALDDRDAKVRLAVIEAISPPSFYANPPKEMARGLKDVSAENRAAVVFRLRFFNQGLDPWVPILLQLAEHDPDPSVRKQCLNTLTNVKPPAVTVSIVPMLIASLKNSNASIRGQAASLLSHFKASARASIPELLRVLNEPLSPGVGSILNGPMTMDPACAAAWALGQIAPGSADEKKVIAALIEFAHSDSRGRCSWAAYGLGEIGPAAGEAVPVLIQVIRDATPAEGNENEAAAALALGQIAPDTPWSDQAIAALLPVLKSKDVFAKLKAIEALGRFGPKTAVAIPAIRALKDDHNLEIRENAAKTLRTIESGNAP